MIGGEQYLGPVLGGHRQADVIGGVPGRVDGGHAGDDLAVVELDVGGEGRLGAVLVAGGGRAGGGL